MNPKEIKAPFLKYDDIRPIAADFLKRYNSEDIIPVPIEKIAEFDLDIMTLRTDKLRSMFDIEGWIANDFSYIYVDSDVYDNYDYRYYFTIAHEIGHMILHRDIYASLNYTTCDELLDIMNIEPVQYGYIEQQAYNFAGLVLVPENRLRTEYRNAVRIVEEQGFDVETNKELFNDYVCNRLQKIFNVSKQTMSIRIVKDGL